MTMVSKNIRKLIIRHTVTGVSIFLIAVIFLIPIYKIAWDNTQELFLKDVTAQLTMALNQLTTDIEYMQKSVIDGMKSDASFQRLATGHGGMRLDTLQTARFIENHKKTYYPASVQDMLVFFKNDDSVLMRTRMLSPGQYTKDIFFRYASYDIESWRGLLFTEQRQFYPQQQAYFKEKKNLTCFVYNHYPVGEEPAAVFSVMIDAEKAMEPFLTDAIAQNGFVYITDSGGTVLVSHNYGGNALPEAKSGQKIRLGGDEYTLVALSSEERDLRIVVGVNQLVFYDNVRAFLSSSLAYLAAAFSLAFAVSAAYALRSVRPLEPVLSRIADMTPLATSGASGEAGKGEEPDVYRYMDSALTAAARHYSNVQSEINSLRKAQTEESFSLLLHGDARQIAACARDIAVLNGAFVLTLIDIEHADEDALGYVAAMLPGVLESLFEDIYVHHGNRLCAVIGLSRSGGPEGVAAGLERTCKIIVEMKPETVLRFGVSDPASKAGELSQAYSQAGYVLQHLGEERSRFVMSYSGIPQKSKEIDFTLFESLYHKLLAGEAAGVALFFEEILPEHVNRVVNSYEQETVFRVLSALFRAVIGKMPDSSGIFMCGYQGDVEPTTLIRRYGETALAICARVNKGKRSHNVRLKNEIVAFIERNYANPELNLPMLGDYFDISHRYISQFIKEQTGHNYTDLLEDIRLGEAAKLLTETSLPIEKISHAVGFENKNTFYKAFKRRHNVSPMAYRSKNRENIAFVKQD